MLETNNHVRKLLTGRPKRETIWVPDRKPIAYLWESGGPGPRRVLVGPIFDCGSRLDSNRRVTAEEFFDLLVIPRCNKLWNKVFLAGGSARITTLVVRSYWNARFRWS